MTNPSTIRPPDRPAGPDQGPQFLLHWPSPLQVLRGNLADHLLGRVVPRIVTSSAPDPSFWKDIDLRWPYPRRGALGSVLWHALLIALLYAASLTPRHPVRLVESSRLEYLAAPRVSTYLPEMHGARTRRNTVGKADPAPGQQEIRSLPDAPDNLRQTIVAPPRVKLKEDVALPNLATMNTVTPLQAIEASAKQPRLTLPPELLPQVVAPTVETSDVRARGRLPQFVPMVIQPAPDAAVEHPKLALPTLLPNVVQPAPEVGNLQRGSNGKLAQSLNGAANTAPPAPAVGQNLRSVGGPLLALSLHPAEVNKPVEMPSGNRSGEFATSPAARPTGSGAPGGNEASGSGAPPASGKINAPAGIDVSAPPPHAAVASIASNGNGPGGNGALPNGPTPAPDPATRSRLLAAMRAPAPTSNIPPRIVEEKPSAPDHLEMKAFNGRRSYTLAVNMPNLNASTGSWIIHFAERGAADHSTPIAAPEVVSKSDPAFPGDLAQDGVHGTVVLTAIIRADGHVSDIAVAKGLEPRLDRNAMDALARWVFRPAMKNGQAIDLEAVIIVPFRASRTKF